MDFGKKYYQSYSREVCLFIFLSEGMKYLNLIFGHLNKSIISCRNMIDCGLILVPKFIRQKIHTNNNKTDL